MARTMETGERVRNTHQQTATKSNATDYGAPHQK